MRKKMSFKRTVSLLLALILSVSSLTIPAFAETATMTDLIPTALSISPAAIISATVRNRWTAATAIRSPRPAARMSP